VRTLFAENKVCFARAEQLWFGQSPGGQRRLYIAGSFEVRCVFSVQCVGLTDSGG